MSLHDRCQVKVLDEVEFAEGGSLQRSLWDLDTPEDYAAALAAERGLVLSGGSV